MSDSEKMIPRLCSIGCGFYGRDENHGLCSGCYDDYLREKISIMLADLSLMHLKPEVDEANRGRLLPKLSDQETSMVQDSESRTSHLPMLSIPSLSLKGTMTRARSRCTVCEKRVGLIGFPCQYCEDVFCGSHRHTEDHACSVNLKRIGRRALAEQNPDVKSDKLGFRV